MTNQTNADAVQGFLNGLSSLKKEGDGSYLPTVYSKEQIDPTSLVALEELLRQCPPSSLPSISLTQGEQLILSQIQRQNSLIYQLHERMDLLQRVCESMHDETGHRRFDRPESASTPGSIENRSSEVLDVVEKDAPAPVATPAPPPIQIQRNPRPILRNPGQLPQRNAALQRIQNRWRRHLFKLRFCCTLYIELLRRYQIQQGIQNNNVDPLFLLKVLIVLAILMSRLPPHLTGRSKDGTQNADEELMYQYIVVSVLIITFIMIRSGRYAFFYQFFWKYNIARRIWSQPDGEALLTADALWQEHWAPAARVPAPGGIAPPPPVHQRVLQWWLLHDWFQGRPIHAPPQDNAPPPPPRGIFQQSLLFIQDVIVFLVSFVLSIFPMWRNLDPQALFPAPRNGPDNANPLGVEERMPLVEAPRDPAANDEEDDEDEEGEEDESEEE